MISRNFGGTEIRYFFFFLNGHSIVAFLWNTEIYQFGENVLSVVESIKMVRTILQNRRLDFRFHFGTLHFTHVSPNGIVIH